MKLPTKKLVISSIVAASIAVFPQIGSHHSTAHAASINTNQIINYGEANNSVRVLQNKLQNLHYYHDSVDGIYGSNTRSAVRSFQRDHKLSVDGIAGPNTLGKLFASSTSSKASNDKSSSITQTLRYGDRGQAVKTLQKTLNNLSYNAGTVDGIFGSQTRNAVKDFQDDQGLQVDGIVGTNTRAALENPKTGTRATQTTTTATTMSYSSSVDEIITDAKALMGVPYRWGGTTPSGFDCSGFTSYVFAKNGITLPRTSTAQYSGGQSVSSLSKGDLVFFNTSGHGISHVGIYIGGGQFISSSSSHGVSIASMNNSYWKPRYVGAKSYTN